MTSKQRTPPFTSPKTFCKGVTLYSIHVHVAFRIQTALFKTSLILENL